MFAPRLALASLSGQSDAEWARSARPHIGAAFLGGIAICERTRDAARALRERDRTEFLPPDPIRFIDAQLTRLADDALHPAVNVRVTDSERLKAAAETCATHEAILELNAHCRQDEMCATGAGETLLRDPDRLAEYVRKASEGNDYICVKVRGELDDVDLVHIASRIESAGGWGIHVDAMDTPRVVEPIADSTELFVIANNGVRDRRSAEQYLECGADALSIGRAHDRPTVLRSVSETVTDWFGPLRPPIERQR